MALRATIEQVYDRGVLERLREALDELCDVDPEAVADGESITELHRCLARLEAATTRARGAFDASRE